MRCLRYTESVAITPRSRYVQVADDDGGVIGYAYAAAEGYDYMALRGPAGVLHDVIVDPDHRGRGVGRLLLDATLAFFKSRGMPRVVLLDGRAE